MEEEEGGYAKNIPEILKISLNADFSGFHRLGRLHSFPVAAPAKRDNVMKENICQMRSPRFRIYLHELKHYKKRQEISTRGCADQLSGSWQEIFHANVYTKPMKIFRFSPS